MEATRTAPAEITYTLSKDDYWRLSRFWMRCTPAGRRAVFFSGVLPGLLTAFLVGAVMIALNPDGPLALAAAFAALALAAFVPVTYGGTKWNAHQAFRKAPDHFKTATLRISPTGFHTGNLSFATEVAWSAVPDVTRDEYALYFFVAERQAIIIPMRAFPNAAAGDAFFDTARGYWTAARTPLPV